MQFPRYALTLAGLCWLSACGASSTAPGQSTPQAVPKSAADTVASMDSRSENDTVKARAGSITLQLTSATCQKFIDNLTICDKGNELSIASDDGSIKQTLTPESVFVDNEKLVYHGPLSEAKMPEAHTFVLSDVNSDGNDDLLIWAGREGAYGGPSFDVYLFDSAKHEFNRSQSFSDLTAGYVGLFSVDAGKIKTASVEGCCLHIYETYSIESNEPKLIERVTEDSSDGKSKVKMERLVDGKVKEVQ